MSTLLQDLRYALRSLGKSRGFTLTALLCLGLGIGVNTAAFSIVNTMLLRPLPFADADRIVSLYATNARQGVGDWGLSFADLHDFQDAGGVFQEVAALDGRSFTLTGGDRAERVHGSAVTPNLFPLLGVQPELGRNFRADEAQPAGFEPVVLLSHGLWVRRFGADPSIVGRTVHLNGRKLTVVGVMPQSFEFPETDELWVPLGPGSGESRAQRHLWGIGKLRPGATVEQAQRALNEVTARLAEEYPASNRNWGARVLSFRDDVVDSAAQRLLYVMLGAVGFVLLIACANVANLSLARAADRGRELAVRAALGASRGRIVRQLLTESMLLALAGGALGVLIAVWSVDLFVAAIPFPEDVPAWMHFGVDGHVLLYTLLISVGTGLLFGCLPALRVSRLALYGVLREGGRGGSGNPLRNRLRGALVVGEVALSLVLLVGATLMIKSFLQLQKADPGFDPAPVLTARLMLTGDQYDPIHARAAFYQQVSDRLAALPGVQAAAATTAIPTDDGGPPREVTAAGRQRAPGEELVATVYGSTPGLFDALGAPLLAGRDFTPAEAADSTGAVVIVNQALAAKLWPDGEAIGRRIRVGDSGDAPWLTVIGVAPDLVYEEIGEETPQSRLQVHLPYARIPSRQMAFLVRSAGDPAALAGSVRREVAGIDPSQALFDVRTMPQVRLYTTWEQRLFGKIFGAFAAVALLLAVAGIYGVMTYAVAQRVREIGIRMALGAHTGDVARLIVGGGAAVAALGVALGLVGAVGLTRLLRGILYGVSATDPTTFVLVAALLGCVALLASWLPARRATRVDPMEALRAE